MMALRQAYSELSNLSVLSGNKASCTVFTSCSLGQFSASGAPPEESENAQNTESKSSSSLQPSSNRMTWSRNGRRLKQGSLRPNLRDTVRRRVAASWRDSDVWNEKGSTAWCSSDMLIFEGCRCLCTFLKVPSAVEVNRWPFIAGA